MVQLMPLPPSFASVKSRLVLPFCYRLTYMYVVLDKGLFMRVVVVMLLLRALNMFN